MKQSAKPWLRELFLPTINHMFGSPASLASAVPAHHLVSIHTSNCKAQTISLWSRVFLFLSFPFCPSPFRLPAPSVPSAKEFSAIHHVQRKLYLAAAAEPLRMHSCIVNTPEGRFPSASVEHGPYPLPHLLLRADT